MYIYYFEEQDIRSHTRHWNIALYKGEWYNCYCQLDWLYSLQTQTHSYASQCDKHLILN